jgi:hypothetical protein
LPGEAGIEHESSPESACPFFVAEVTLPVMGDRVRLNGSKNW